MKRQKHLFLATAATLLSFSANNYAEDIYQVHIQDFPAKAENVFIISQAGHDDPSKNPGGQPASFDIIKHLPSTATATVPVLPHQKELAKTEFDFAAIYRIDDEFGKKYLLIDCPNMIPNQVNEAKTMTVTPKESQFLANETLAGMKPVLGNDLYAKSEAYLTVAIQNFIDHKMTVRVCNNDKGGIFDVNAPVSKQMSSELSSQIGKLAKQWWNA